VYSSQGSERFIDIASRFTSRLYGWFTSRLYGWFTSRPYGGQVRGALQNK